MIYIVTADNRRLFRHALMDMHCQRKAVFIDELGWRLNSEAGIEIDSYDSEDVIYLIEADDPRAPVTGSARLLPTTRPHLLGDIFADLCANDVPCGPNIWEATRFCPAPGMAAPGRRALLLRMIAAIIETGLLFGIERVSFVASAALAPLAERAGWSIAALGPSQRKGRERLKAFIADIDAGGLRSVRANLAMREPLTRFLCAQSARAA